jgi:hypothetical protein
VHRLKLALNGPLTEPQTRISLKNGAELSTKTLIYHKNKLLGIKKKIKNLLLINYEIYLYAIRRIWSNP